MTRHHGGKMVGEPTINDAGDGNRVSAGGCCSGTPRVATMREGECCSPSTKKAVGDLAVDPVCGMEVDRASPLGGSLKWEGAAFYFCSTFCRARFAARPRGR